MTGSSPLAARTDAQHLCASAELVERGRARVFDLLQYGQPVRAFALRFDGKVVAYLNRSLHVPVEMDWQPGVFLDREQRFIVCATHGATYEPLGGRCVAGPGGRGRLTPVDVAEFDGDVYWYPSRDIRPCAEAPTATGTADESPR